jgi:hypothetical protein
VTVYTPSPATATGAGYDTGASINGDLMFARGTAVGFGHLVIGANPPAGAAPDALRLEIVTNGGTQLIADLPRRNLSFVVEHNGSGSISFETDLDKLPAGMSDPLLDPHNLVRVHFGDLAAWPYGVAEGVLAASPPTKDDSGRWVLSMQCTGSWDVLDYGVLWPPDGATGDTREFSYTAGQTGPAWIEEEWGKPSGYLIKSSFRWEDGSGKTKKKHHWPRGWPEEKARWIWSSSPEKNSAEGSRKFVGTFTLTAKKNVHFYAAGDDNMRLYLNGARIKTKGRGAWKRTSSFIRTLKAGTYTVAAEVANMPGGDNKSGFIFAAAQLKADGTREKWLLRSSTDSFKVRTAGGYFGQVPLPPDGWYPAAVLLWHVNEAKARNVDYHPQITTTYSYTADTSGAAWTAKGQSEYDIGTSGAQLGDMVRSSGVDVAMLPGLRLSAWRSRGFDLRDRIALGKPMGTGWSSKTWSRVRTVALTHHESGWTQSNGDVTVSATYGRRELTVSGGGTDGDLQADALAQQALSAAGTPEETIEVTITNADPTKPQPFRDFNVADIVSVETIGGFTAIKVMSITGAEQESKEVRWTIAGYPV